MQCPACDYSNPKGATLCIECGAPFEWHRLRKAEGRFSRDLEEARRSAERRRHRARRPDGPKP